MTPTQRQLQARRLVIPGPRRLGKARLEVTPSGRSSFTSEVEEPSSAKHGRGITRLSRVPDFLETLTPEGAAGRPRLGRRPSCVLFLDEQDPVAVAPADGRGHLTVVSRRVRCLPLP